MFGQFIIRGDLLQTTTYHFDHSKTATNGGRFEELLQYFVRTIGPTLHYILFSLLCCVIRSQIRLGHM